MDYKEFYEKAYSCLLTMADLYGVNNLERYFKPGHMLELYNSNDWNFGFSSITDPRFIMCRLADSLQNSSYMKSIKFYDNRKTIADVLCSFDPEKIMGFKSGDMLLSAFQNNDLGYRKGADKTISRNWEWFCKGIYSGAEFLVSNQGHNLINADRLSTSRAEVRKWVAILTSEIYSLGNALACDFVKEIGYNYGKPDLQIKWWYSRLTGLYNISDDDAIDFLFQIEDAVPGIKVYQVDKVLWLIRTQNFYLDKKQ